MPTFRREFEPAALLEYALDSKWEDSQQVEPRRDQTNNDLAGGIGETWEQCFNPNPETD
jgi:hypothetical protein